jgi:hypothetical protein
MHFKREEKQMKIVNVAKKIKRDIVSKIERFVLIFSLIGFNLCTIVYAEDNNEIIKGTVTDIFNFIQVGFFISALITGLMAGKSYSDSQTNDDPGANKTFRGQVTAALVLLAIAIGVTVFRDRIIKIIIKE